MHEYDFEPNNYIEMHEENAMKILLLLPYCALWL